MTRVVLDTNVVLSFLTDRNPSQQSRAAALFRLASRGELELLLHQTVVTEMVYVLSNLYELATPDIAAILRDLLSLPSVLPVNDLRWSTVLDIWPGRVSDFADACLAAVAKDMHADGVASFDRRFAKQMRQVGLKCYQEMGPA